MTNESDLLRQLHDAVVDFDEAKAKSSAEAWLAAGLPAVQGIMDGLVSGMNTVGRLFKAQEYFVPEVLLCAEALNAGLAVLKPHLEQGNMQSAGVVVIGTIQGDIHDLGKNLVGMMLGVAGFTVHDLGVDVPVARFQEAVREHNASIVGISAMVTTMMGIKQAIPLLKESSPHIRIMVGGAPLNPEIARMFKADGYAPNAADAVAEAHRLMTL